MSTRLPLAVLGVYSVSAGLQSHLKLALVLTSRDMRQLGNPKYFIKRVYMCLLNKHVYLCSILFPVHVFLISMFICVAFFSQSVSS